MKLRLIHGEGGSVREPEMLPREESLRLAREADWPTDAEDARMCDWPDQHPDWQALIAEAGEIAARERAS
jgi:hypothetical protein